MIDHNFVKAKFVESSKYLIKIDEFMAEEDFIKNIDNQLKGERIFEILAQVILDICTHISSKSNVGVPNSYSSCIETLVDLKVLPETELSKFQNLIKMRNIIVHQYGKINYSILFNGLKSLKKDFELFKNLVLDFLEKIEI